VGVYCLVWVGEGLSGCTVIVIVEVEIGVESFALIGVLEGIEDSVIVEVNDGSIG